MAIYMNGKVVSPAMIPNNSGSALSSNTEGAAALSTGSVSSSETKIQTLSLNLCDDYETFKKMRIGSMLAENELYLYPDPIPTKANNIALIGDDGRIVDSGEQLDFSDSNISWGTNIRTNNNISPVASSMVSNSNVLALIEPSGMNVEYTQDGGVTWIDYEATDDNKRGACDDLRPATLQLGKRSSSDTASDGLRITINAVDALIFCRTQYLVFVTVGSMQFKLEFANKNSPTTFVEKYTGTVNGTTSVPLNGELFGSSSDSDNYITVMRLTFLANKANNGYFVNRLQLYSDLIYGNSGLNSLARYGHLYKWDFSQNAIFPSNVTATTFIGNLNGNAVKAGAVVDNGDSKKTIQIGWTGDSLTSDNFEYLAGYSKTGNIKDVSWGTVNNKVVPQKSLGVADYNNTDNVVKVGWTGDSLNSSTLYKLAGYTESGNVKEASTDAVLSLLGIKSSSWEPVVSGAGSYTYRWGSYVKIGNMVIVSFAVFGLFSSSAEGDIAITGCPVSPSGQYAAGGGNASGYMGADNIVFTGWSIDTAGVIEGKTQWATTSGTKWNNFIRQSAGASFQFAGTIAFQV